MTFKVITLGCKVNSCESAAIERNFEKSGFTKTEDEKANVYIINSCAVTGTAAAKARHALSKCRRENPKAAVVLCGCFPQSYPEDAGLNYQADIITGNAEKPRLPQLVKEYLKTRVKTVKIAPLSREYDEKSAVPDEDRTRAFIKIEDGCDRFCSYCIIPYARGRARSLPLETVARQAEQCVKNGHKEIVLTGINLGCYGQELGLTLADAVKAAAKSGVARLRLSSLEPEMLSDGEIEKLAEIPALCPHFHLSLQSGSDTVLKRMNRKYNSEQYIHIVEKLREKFPDCAVTTDIIVGFPEESDEEFEETLNLAERLGFVKIHIFPYSVRKGTVAAVMEQVFPAVKSERIDELTALAKRSAREFLKTQVGRECTVLIEKPQSREFSQGFAENYTPVRIFGVNLERHSLAKVKLTEQRDGFCVGELI